LFPSKAMKINTPQFDSRKFITKGIIDVKPGKPGVSGNTTLSGNCEGKSEEDTRDNWTKQEEMCCERRRR